MNFKEYQELTRRTRATTEERDHLINGALGLAGETGEVIDLIKKASYQGHDLDRDKIAEELGDVLWYIAQVADGAGLNLDDVAKANIDKLSKRYPNGFSEARSVNRKDEDQEGQVVEKEDQAGQEESLGQSIGKALEGITDMVFNKLDSNRRAFKELTKELGAKSKEEADLIKYAILTYGSTKGLLMEDAIKEARVNLAGTRSQGQDLISGLDTLLGRKAWEACPYVIEREALAVGVPIIMAEQVEGIEAMPYRILIKVDIKGTKDQAEELEARINKAISQDLGSKVKVRAK